MGSFANTLFKVMLGWLQGATSAVWSAFTSKDGTSFLTWIGRNWLPVAGILCAIGLLADLCVYLLRWKPYKVWKSFFSRNREEEKTEAKRPAHASPVTAEVPRESVRDMSGRREEPDLSYWEKEEEIPGEPEPQPASVPATVTKSGYVVPADSPYRRPAEPGKARTPAVPEPERAAPYPGEEATVSHVSTGRRRRIRVSELFSDPEEDIRDFDAPQHVIDARRAYHEPVYPRGWKKSEDDRE